MKCIHVCPVCGTEASHGWPAILAPFIVERVLDATSAIGRVLQCERCGFRYFSLRLEDGEVSRLYRDYRNEDYFSCRHRHEPWYSRRMNGDLGTDMKELRHRQEALELILRKAGAWDRIRTVLDYGGDRGQFIPVGLTAEKWVFEISGVQPIQGVGSVKDVLESKGMTFDLVMLCHVLEHVMEPKTFLRQVLANVALSGMIYVEVPLERPHLAAGPETITYAWYRWLESHRLCLLGVDFLSTVARTQISWLPPLGLLKVSEHVNFFDEGSLRSLLTSEGFVDVWMGTHPKRRLVGRSGVIKCLARRSADAN